MALSREGFKFISTKEKFVRSREGLSDVFQLVCLNGKPGWRIQPNIGIRVDALEDIFHEISGTEKRYQKNTCSIGGGVGNIFYGDNRKCEFVLISDADVAIAVEGVEKVFHEFAMPYFEKYGSIYAIDELLNTSPSERSRHRGPWLRCSTGVIAAKLSNRENYDAIVSVYAETMKTIDNGVHVARFKALLDVLDSMSPLH